MYNLDLSIYLSIYLFIYLSICLSIIQKDKRIKRDKKLLNEVTQKKNNHVVTISFTLRAIFSWQLILHKTV